MLGSKFQFHSNFESIICNQIVLNFLPMFHKRDARLIWVKLYFIWMDANAVYSCTNYETRYLAQCICLLYVLLQVNMVNWPRHRWLRFSMDLFLYWNVTFWFFTSDLRRFKQFPYFPSAIFFHKRLLTKDPFQIAFNHDHWLQRRYLIFFLTLCMLGYL